MPKPDWEKIRTWYGGRCIRSKVGAAILKERITELEACAGWLDMVGREDDAYTKRGWAEYYREIIAKWERRERE